ncbi:tRNA (adenosine(37)-N6)-dimethylallyltransferase MiaA [Candidatus Peregrinibacteria bacterium]|nr:tRNA (adenosine(37)-N6)-dimethylallyltransferase MiaA [Candidatus Peregrinibacteria bacterium]
MIEKIQNFIRKNSKPLIVVLGPTASGKTKLAIAIAKKFKGEIVNADSRQVYQEMNIGTAKPTIQEQKQAKHHLIDIIKPDQSYSLSDYKKQAESIIDNLHKNEITPVLSGGTGLYLSAIIENYQLPDVKPNQKLRSELEKLSNEQLQQNLNKIDPQKAKTIHPNNRRYIIRAIETANQPVQKSTPKYQTMKIGIEWPRKKLYQRIETRIDQQLDAGLLEEARQLLKKYPHDLSALTSLGYQELGKYFKNLYNYEQAIEEFKKNTRNYAKRQLTWFRRYQDINWIAAEEIEQIINALKK